jgi:hypothetical protein
MEFGSLSARELLDRWEVEPNFEVRTAIVKEMQTRTPKLFPSREDTYEKAFGLYPSTEDPNFHEKLFAKREFLENRQKSVADTQEELDRQGKTACDMGEDFELSTVQRFISRYLSPQCPYQSALLFHGVGVGKTFAAVATAEAYLESFPNRKVIIVAPPNIQPNFRRTIFNIDLVTIPPEETIPNSSLGFTETFYLKQTGMEYEKDKTVIANRVRSFIDARYDFMGYRKFGSYIDRTGSQGAFEKRAFSREFDGRLIIIDEAHNLRDVPGETEDDNADSLKDDEEGAGAGKRLTPSLTKLLKYVHGMKLMLMTATPMYNNYIEIVFLLNLLLLNDKRARIQTTDIFDGTGWKKNKEGKEIGRELLGQIASAYVSFMRGENPLKFPIRLMPLGAERFRSWPSYPPAVAESKELNSEEEFKLMKRLPLVPVRFTGSSLKSYMDITEEAAARGGVSVGAIEKMVEAGNWLFPGEGRPTGNEGFSSMFQESAAGSSVQFSLRGDGDWLSADSIGDVSPKAKLILDRIQHGVGVSFIFSRFIRSGALPLALALEANGYTVHGRDVPFLKEGAALSAASGGRQCAFCSLRETGHPKLVGRKDNHPAHSFRPAKYILLTGTQALSPNNGRLVEDARAFSNSEGKDVKVIIGSQVASEGVDFRFVRELYVFDSWFHLNKMEQVLGRGVRNCSHSALRPVEIDGRWYSQQNCTIYLLVTAFPEGEDRETADMYMYRRAMRKAMEMGRVTRVLKEYALDCNLNIDAIKIPSGSLPSQKHIDSQGIYQDPLRKEVIVTDTPYTSICDWIESCDYICRKSETEERAPLRELKDADTSTYDEYAARAHEAKIRRVIRNLFAIQVSYQFDELHDNLSGVPPLALSSILSGIVGNQSFRVTSPSGKEGYIIYRNGYYLFQPDFLKDRSIPLALRVANYPVKRDVYLPDTTVTTLVRAREDIGIWGLFMVWAKAIGESSASTKLPDEIMAEMEKRYSGDQGEVHKAKQQVETMVWIYEKIKGHVDSCVALERTVLEYVWDEILTMKEQQSLVKSGEAITLEIAKQQVLKRDTFRYIDFSTAGLRYICADGAACPEAVTRVLDADTFAPADTTTTGRIYGFMVPKKGEMIFKTNEKVAAVGGKPEKGGECGNISTVSFHVKMLVEIGKILESYDERQIVLSTDLRVVEEEYEEKGRMKKKSVQKDVGTLGELRPAVVADLLKELARTSHERKIRYIEEHKWQEFPRNAVRACALKDLLLRWMNAKKVGGKRWFYRPVESIKTKHKGLPLKV